LGSDVLRTQKFRTRSFIKICRRFQLGPQNELKQAKRASGNTAITHVLCMKFCQNHSKDRKTHITLFRLLTWSKPSLTQNGFTIFLVGQLHRVWSKLVTYMETDGKATAMKGGVLTQSW